MGQNEHTPTAYEIISWKTYGWKCRRVILFFLVQAVRLRLKWVRKLNENMPTTELRLNKCESVYGEGTHLVFIEMFANSVLFSNSLLFVYQLETRFYWGRYNHIRCYLV